MRAIHEYRLLLISPSDVGNERDAVTDVVRLWNAQIGSALGARIEVVRWESHATPDLAAAPQQVLNRQLLPECDFAIALFWSRLGTPTAEYQSGSDEEIRRLLAAGVRILVYFNRSPIPQDNLGDDQYLRLKDLRAELEAKGLIGYYDSIGNLREQIHLHMTNVVTTLLSGTLEVSDDPQTGQVLTATTPDVRVQTAAGFIAYAGGGPEPVLSIDVANHSPVPVYIAAVLIELHDGNNLFPRSDSATGKANSRTRLDPGDSFAFNITPDDILPVVTDPATMRRALARDAIGRVYYSDEEEFVHQIQLVFSRDT